MNRINWTALFHIVASDMTGPEGNLVPLCSHWPAKVRKYFYIPQNCRQNPKHHDSDPNVTGVMRTNGLPDRGLPCLDILQGWETNPSFMRLDQMSGLHFKLQTQNFTIHDDLLMSRKIVHKWHVSKWRFQCKTFISIISSLSLSCFIDSLISLVGKNCQLGCWHHSCSVRWRCRRFPGGEAWCDQWKVGFSPCAIFFTF